MAGIGRPADAALSLFDDAIVRAARGTGLPVLEMRAICSDEADFANPIEPSSVGGEKVARALRDVVLHHDFAGRRTVIYP
jgi:hypothetical protein